MKKQTLIPFLGLILLMILPSCEKEPEKEKEEIETCVSEDKVIPFEAGGRKYELVLATQNWLEASKCAVERGGYLAEINSVSEQGNIYSSVRNKITDPALTFSTDGNGSYLWLGGNDLAIEGNWIWDGNNDGMGPQFWEGLSNGVAINDLYSNWGQEPDDFEVQDALGLAITDWPRGVAGEWNDLDDGNRLYFIIEFD